MTNAKHTFQHIVYGFTNTPLQTALHLWIYRVKSGVGKECYFFRFI